MKYSLLHLYNALCTIANTTLITKWGENTMLTDQNPPNHLSMVSCYWQHSKTVRVLRVLASSS